MAAGAFQFGSGGSWVRVVCASRYHAWIKAPASRSSFFSSPCWGGRVASSWVASRCPACMLGVRMRRLPASVLGTLPLKPSPLCAPPWFRRLQEGRPAAAAFILSGVRHEAGTSLSLTCVRLYAMTTPTRSLLERFAPGQYPGAEHIVLKYRGHAQRAAKRHDVRALSALHMNMLAAIRALRDKDPGPDGGQRVLRSA